MKNKFYYISGYHAIAYCHDESKDDVILGGLSAFLDDAKTNIFRQKISKRKFLKLGAVEVSHETAKDHPNLYFHDFYLGDGAWRIVGEKTCRTLSKPHQPSFRSRSFFL